MIRSHRGPLSGGAYGSGLLDARGHAFWRTKLRGIECASLPDLDAFQSCRRE